MLPPENKVDLLNGDYLIVEQHDGTLPPAADLTDTGWRVGDPYVSLQIWTTVGPGEDEPYLVGAGRLDQLGAALLTRHLREWLSGIQPLPERAPENTPTVRVKRLINELYPDQPSRFTGYAMDMRCAHHEDHPGVVCLWADGECVTPRHDTDHGGTSID